MIEGATDGDLVRRIARSTGSPSVPAAREAEAELCRRFGPRVRLYGLRHLKDEDRAADLVQGVLLAVLEAARAGRIEKPDQVDRFVLGTCRNASLRDRQHGDRTRPAEGAELDTGIFMPEVEPIPVRALNRCMSRLEPRSRTVLLMSFQDERTADQIAKALETSVGNVRVLRHRALAQLRGCLDSGEGASQ